MKTKLTLLSIFLSLFLAFTCSEDDNQQEEYEALQEQYTKIVALSESVTCENAEDWNFTAFGSKACGGAKGYIAYSTSIDTEAFLQMVQDYNEAEAAYNIKWGIVSDCMAVMPPQGVICQDGKPVLVYND